MIVADLMTTGLVTVLPETTLADTARIMLARHLGGLPVLDRAGALVGIVTDGDLLCRAELNTDDEHPGWLQTLLRPGHLAADYVKTHGRHVADVMTRDPLTVTAQTELADAADLMRKHHFKRLPVVDEQGRLTGMLGRTDLLAALAQRLIRTANIHPSDEAIRAAIEATFKAESWAPKAGVRVSVHNAVVELEGIVMSDEERKAVNVIAANAAGVVSVKDDMVFIDPGSGMAFS
jgi:CBS domain-containing protein